METRFVQKDAHFVLVGHVHGENGRNDDCELRTCCPVSPLLIILTFQSPIAQDEYVETMAGRHD
jgi:hypothetical protein